MFLVRSAFWLTAAFVAIHPNDMDLGATARSLSGQALAAGEQVVVSQILKNECTPSSCAPKIVAIVAQRTANLDTPSVGPTMQDSPIPSPAPFPRRRPDWMG